MALLSYYLFSFYVTARLGSDVDKKCRPELAQHFAFKLFGLFGG